MKTYDLIQAQLYISGSNAAFFQEEQNRGKPNWEHLNDELHVLITVEDTENRAKLKTITIRFIRNGLKLKST